MEFTLYGTYAVFYNVYVVGTLLFLLLDNRDTSSTIAWSFVIILFPPFGLIAYILFGRNWRRKSFRRKKEREFFKQTFDKALSSLFLKQKEYMNRIAKDHDELTQKLTRLLYNNSSSLLTTKNDVIVFHKGKDKFSTLLQDIANAKKYIHLEYFIWRSDELTEKIKNALIERAKAGVEVRILTDAFGMILTREKYLREMRSYGIEIRKFSNFLYLTRLHTLNYRNHRKIIVIDGMIGYTGGMNMGQEYVTGGRRFSSWRDVHLKITGEAAQMLQATFASNWYVTTKNTLLDPKYYPEVKEKRNCPVQLITSGPDSPWSSIEQLYISLIVGAKKQVRIMTPYFVPTQSLVAVLKTIALSGVKVDILMTGKPDKHLPFWSAQTYYPELLRAGVNIYQYKEGFMHAKVVVVDKSVSSIGSANLDNRSLQLNYEINTIVYDTTVATGIDEQFCKDLKQSRKITLVSLQGIRPFVRIRNSLARLLAPLQ